MATQEHNQSDARANEADRRRLAFEAAAQIDTLAGMIGRELEGDDSPAFNDFVLPALLNRIKALASVIISVDGGDDKRTIDEMCAVLTGDAA